METLIKEDQLNKGCQGTPCILTNINIEVLTNGYNVRLSYDPYREAQATYIQSLDELKDLL